MVFFSDNANVASTQVLQQVTLPIISGPECNASNIYGGLITDRMICAGEAQGGRDTCSVSI